jgi:hypothetical protein
MNSKPETEREVDDVVELTPEELAEVGGGGVKDHSV